MSLLSRYADLGQSFTPSDVMIKNALRINTLKITEKELVARLMKKGVLLEKIPFVVDAYWYISDFSLGATPEYLQGYYYLQETASLLPALLLDPKDNDVVLDMAAAPGSKTTQLAQMMHDKGTIIALDTEHLRLASLRNNVERLGITSVTAYKKDARFADDITKECDKVLLDAPCSGNFCIESDFFMKRTVADFKQKARLQRELLKSAYKVLKQGGVLVYSTCSLEPEENELVVEWFINQYKDMSLEKITLPIGEPALTKVFDQELDPSLKNAWRLWPHKTNTQGFFIAKLKKSF